MHTIWALIVVLVFEGTGIQEIDVKVVDTYVREHECDIAAKAHRERVGDPPGVHIGCLPVPHNMVF